MDSHFLVPFEKPEPKLKIAYVGNFTQTHCTEVHIKKSLAGLGHEVVAIQESNTPPADVLNVDDILERARGCDVFLYTRTWGMNPTADHDGMWLLAELKKLGMPTAAVHLDLYVGLARETDIQPGTNPFWSTDHVFTADGGHQEYFAAKGVNHHHFSPGILDSEAYLGTPQEEMSADIVFVGTYKGYPPEWPFRQRLIEWLQATYGDRFEMWVDGRGVRNQDLNNLYASAKIAIGDSIYTSEYCSDRFFETVGRGGFLIAATFPGLEKFFPPGMLATYDNQQGSLTDFSELKLLIDYYLEHDAERERCRRRCFEHVRRNHTYMHRMKEVLATIQAAEVERPAVEVADTPQAAAPNEVQAERKKCLNLGSGKAGLLTRFPHLEGFEIVNVDLMDFGDNVVHDLSLLPWPFEANTFDEIIAIDILEHFVHVIPIVNEMIRVCKPGGQMFVQVPSAEFPEAVWTDPGHHHGFAQQSFDYWVKGSDFNVAYGQINTQGRFFITALVVEKLNRNLTFSFKKDDTASSVIIFPYGDREYTIEGWGPEELIFRSIKLTNTFYEIEELETMKTIGVESNRTGVYVDIGANIGNHSIFFVGECGTDYVIAIEAIGPLAKLAEKNLQRNIPPEKWKAIHSAVVDSDEPTVTLWQAGDINMGRSQLPKPGMVASDVNLSGKTVEVPAARLDDLLSDVPKVRFIKLDIEGDEVAALKSGMQIIARDRPVIACECSVGWDQEPNAEMAEITALLTPLGYRLHAGPIGYAQGPMYIWE